uniref:Methyltransferase n=2 Tax=Zea mays TaxID=4577 RepID=A0A804U914_MAIZE
MQHSSPPMWPPSHQRHDASCEEDDLYGYGGIVNEWGTIGLLLLEAAAERIVGDGALETWGVADKATRVKLCMLARGRSHASRRAARNVFEERQLHSHLHRVVVAALSIQVPHLPRHHERSSGSTGMTKSHRIPSCHRGSDRMEGPNHSRCSYCNQLRCDNVTNSIVLFALFWIHTRLEELGISSNNFSEDNEIWHSRVIQYWKHLKFEIQKDSFRYVMDMSASLGGFAASLKKKNVWVMNVVPFTESGKLKIIYDRGLMGTTHDWCESFSTYPGTYDLLHAWLLFSEIEKQGCSLEDLLIEMDRILRTYGYAIIRDKVDVVTYIKKLLPALRWDDWTFEMRPKKDALTTGDERVLIMRKKLWNHSVQDLS